MTTCKPGCIYATQNQHPAACVTGEEFAERHVRERIAVLGNRPDRSGTVCVCGKAYGTNDACPACRMYRHGFDAGPDACWQCEAELGTTEKCLTCAAKRAEDRTRGKCSTCAADGVPLDGGQCSGCVNNPPGEPCGCECHQRHPAFHCLTCAMPPVIDRNESWKSVLIGITVGGSGAPPPLDGVDVVSTPRRGDVSAHLPGLRDAVQASEAAGDVVRVEDVRATPETLAAWTGPAFISGRCPACRGTFDSRAPHVCRPTPAAMLEARDDSRRQGYIQGLARAMQVLAAYGEDTVMASHLYDRIRCIQRHAEGLCLEHGLRLCPDCHGTPTGDQG